MPVGIELSTALSARRHSLSSRHLKFTRIHRMGTSSGEGLSLKLDLSLTLISYAAIKVGPSKILILSFSRQVDKQAAGTSGQHIQVFMRHTFRF